MTTTALIAKARDLFHVSLLDSILTINEKGIPANADSSNKKSIAIARGIVECIETEVRNAERVAGQTSGNQFESLCATFLRETFPRLSNLRPGRWDIHQVSNKRSHLELAQYTQFRHLIELDYALRTNAQLSAALGHDYTITPDVVIARMPEPDETINSPTVIVNDDVANHADLRQKCSPDPILHASISCKWTIRSDRAQNARSEALNLIRNRKGRLPHIAVVTGEPLPSRLASIALGTGDIDCVYHFALDELIQTVDNVGDDDTREMLAIMVEGKRLKDISDLPLDLAV